jgi:hypothetical protein
MVRIGVPAVFRCFSTKITAAELSFVAETLGFRRFGARKNSDASTVLSLFLLLLWNNVINSKAAFS